MKQLYSIFLSIITVYFAFMKCYRGEKTSEQEQITGLQKKCLHNCEAVLSCSVWGCVWLDQKLPGSETELLQQDRDRFNPAEENRSQRNRCPRHSGDTQEVHIQKCADVFDPTCQFAEECTEPAWKEWRMSF